MEKYDINKSIGWKLDYIVDRIKKTKRFNNVFFEMMNEIKIYEGTEELTGLFKTLQEDGYVDYDEMNHYFITIKGKLFEGYQKQKETIYIKNFLNKVQMWAVILGGLSALLYYAMEILKELNRFFCK